MANEPEKKRPRVRVIHTPLVKATCANAGIGASTGAAGTRARATALGDPFIRAEAEDDDGYDPYSDRREEPPLFEENPWD